MADNKSNQEQVIPQLKGAARHDRNKIRMVQNVLLIWLDRNIDQNNAIYRKTMGQLRNILNSINTFTDYNPCIQFVEDMDQEKVCMIVSGTLGEQIVPQVHDMSQIDSIFIFCGNKKYHEQWVKEWYKIKGVFTDIPSICEALKKTADQCEQNNISISIMATGNSSKQNLEQLDASFIYIQIIKDILLQIDFEPKYFNQYIEYCREVLAENDKELKYVYRFEQEYRDKTPIWWYTLECFLYSMVNRGLGAIDVDIIVKMGFFIKDLHNNIAKLHKEQFSGAQSRKKFIVYRGQGMSKTDFEKMRTTESGLISFNNFLSTNKDRSVSLNFAQSALENPSLIGVLFIMTIDPSQSTTPFASIKNVSAIPNEDEVLFGMQTVFRIGNITSIAGNSRLFQAELILISDNDKDLHQLTTCIRKETYSNDEGWFRLSWILQKIGQSEKSEQVYQTLLAQTTDERGKAVIYGQIGRAKYNQEKYKEAITFYEKAEEIYQKNLPSDSLNLALIYNNIGDVYKNMVEYSKAVSYYEKSLEIRQQALPSNHPDLAASYNSIGAVYHTMGGYSNTLPYYETALSYYQKALEIQQKSLSPKHPDLAASYHNIGVMCKNIGKYSKALSYFEQALEIQQQLLPPDHPDLASFYNNLGDLYNEMGAYSKALSYYEKSLEISQKLFSSNHHILAVSYNNIGMVYSNVSEYLKAQSFFERAVKIGQQSLPENHPELQRWKNNLERVKKEL